MFLMSSQISPRPDLCDRRIDLRARLAPATPRRDFNGALYRGSELGRIFLNREAGDQVHPDLDLPFRGISLQRRVERELFWRPTVDALTLAFA